MSNEAIQLCTCWYRHCLLLKCITTTTCTCISCHSVINAAYTAGRHVTSARRLIEDAQYVHHMLCTLTCKRQLVCVCFISCCVCPWSPGICRSCTQWKVVATARSCAVRQNKSYAPSWTQASKVGGGSSIRGRVALMSSSAGTNAKIMLMPEKQKVSKLFASQIMLVEVLPSNITQKWCLLHHKAAAPVYCHSSGVVQWWAHATAAATYCIKANTALLKLQTGMERQDIPVCSNGTIHPCGALCV